MRTTENKVYAKRARAPFDPASAAHRVACQMFPGFASLPTPVLVSLEPYAGLFDPAVRSHSRIEKRSPRPSLVSSRARVQGVVLRA